MRSQSLPLESLARGQSAVGYDPSCPRTFRIAKSTQERKKNCDEAIDGGLQSHSLEPGHGSATCQVGDFTQITELQWVQLQNRAKGSPRSQGLSTRAHDVQTCPEALTPLAVPTTPALTTVASPDSSSCPESTAGTRCFWSDCQGSPPRDQQLRARLPRLQS